MKVEAPEWTCIHRAIQDKTFRNDWCLSLNTAVEIKTIKSTLKLSDHVLLANQIKITKSENGKREGKKRETVLPNKKTSRKITEETQKNECPTIHSLNEGIIRNKKKLKKFIKNKNERDILEYWNNNIKKVEAGRNIDELEKEILEEYKIFIKRVDKK